MWFVKHYVLKTAKLWKSGAALQNLGEKSWEIKGIAAKNGCNDVNANKFNNNATAATVKIY